MAYYKSLREYIEALDNAGGLTTINSPINKDTQLGPLVRLQFRGLPEDQRKGFLFTNVTDSRGKKYTIPVAMGVLAGSRRVYAQGLQCKPDEIPERLAQAYLKPIKPKVVEKAPCQEVVYMGDNLLEKGGMDQFPAPITTPGYDAGPIQSASMWVTKDLETGIRNVGLYRSHIQARDRVGIHLGQTDKDMVNHWQKARARGKPLQCAIVVGGTPNVNFVGPSRLPYGVDEYAVAGGMVGQALEIVKCKTVDLEVPANADVIIEGEMPTDILEMEAPHGEGGGFVGMQEMQPILNIKCITMRKNPVWLTIMSQLAPSESSKLAQINGHASLYKRLKYDMGLKSVLQVANPEFSTGRPGLVIVQFKMHTDQKEIWKALEAVRAETVIAVDDDIDPWHPDQFWWAIAMRALPHRDYKIVMGKSTSMHLFKYLPEEEAQKLRFHQFETNPSVKPVDDSRLLMNATMKWPYPPVALPKKEFMEDALRIWREEGLPSLNLQKPWHGYEVGYWPKQFEEDAQRAVKGEYYKTSEMRAKKRAKVPPVD